MSLILVQCGLIWSPSQLKTLSTGANVDGTWKCKCQQRCKFVVHRVPVLKSLKIKIKTKTQHQGRTFVIPKESRDQDRAVYRPHHWDKRHHKYHTENVQLLIMIITIIIIIISIQRFNAVLLHNGFFVFRPPGLVLLQSLIFFINFFLPQEYTWS